MTDMIIQCVGAIIAVVGFGIVLRVPAKFLWWAGLDGGIGWLIYLTANRMLESPLLSTFLGAMVISAGAHLCARKCRTPVTMFLIPANMTLVPGAGMYRIVYYILQPRNELSMYYFQQTLQTAGMIALAMFVVNTALGNFHIKRENASKRDGENH